MTQRQKTIFDPSIQDTPNGWLLTPAYNLVMFISEELVLAGITERALSSYSTLPLLLFSAKVAAENQNIETQGAFDRLAEFTELDADFAESEVENEFDTVYRHHCVSVWAAIETSVEQTIKNLMSNVADAERRMRQTTPNLSGKKLKLDSYSGLETSFKKWQMAIDARPVMSRYMKMLNAFDVAPDLSEGDVKSLNEMGATRNVLMHNSGFIDRRFIERCPGSKYTLGDHVKIDRVNMKRFFDASSEFTKVFFEKVVKSDYFTVVD